MLLNEGHVEFLLKRISLAYYRWAIKVRAHKQTTIPP